MSKKKSQVPTNQSFDNAIKRNVTIILGGESSEQAVSINSECSLLNHILCSAQQPYVQSRVLLDLKATFTK